MIFYIKRPMMLLEVMIAFSIVALALLPLVATNVVILKTQKEFQHKVYLDHAVNLFYADVMERLYLNRISWTELLAQTFPIDQAMVLRAGLDPKEYPYTGTYKLTPIRDKPKQPAPYSVWLFKLTFTFLRPYKPKEAPLSYEYDVFIVRDLTSRNPL